MRPESEQHPLATESIAQLLNEDGLLALLERRDLPSETLEEIGRNPAVMKSRKISVVLATHPHTPRHLVLRLIRQFYTFDLMRFTLHPAVAADLRRVADEQLIARLTSVTLGQRLTLARRGSQAVAAALLLDQEPRVSHTALENSRLTEAAVIKVLLRPKGSAFVEAVCHHPNGRCGKRYAWRCCAAHTRRSPGLWNLPALFLRRFCATFCTPHICRRGPRRTYGKS